MFPKVELWGRRLVGLVGQVAFQSYARYEVVRGLWKGVGVPALTYASDVLCMPPLLLKTLDTYQWWLGWLALDANSYTTIQEDMAGQALLHGYSNKLKYLGWICHLDKCRPARQPLRIFYKMVTGNAMFTSALLANPQPCYNLPSTVGISSGSYPH